MSSLRPQHAVSSRQLARKTAHLLDEIDETGRPVAILRYGRVAAVLAPMDEQGRFQPSETWKQEEKVVDIAGQAPSDRWHADEIATPQNVGDVLVALTRLEIKGLIERIAGFATLTATGKRVVEAMKS